MDKPEPFDPRWPERECQFCGAQTMGAKVNYKGLVQLICKECYGWNGNMLPKIETGGK